jgi:predicted nucleotide-binding protein
MKDRIFIGSSVEALPIARNLQEQLRHDLDVTVWPQDTFKPSTYPLSQLISSAQKQDFAVFILSPDDEAIIRGKKDKAPRMNVILELGLFVGVLGFENVFFIVPSNTAIHRPSDLEGLTAITYDESQIDNDRCVSSAVTQILNQTSKLGKYQSSKKLLDLLNDVYDNWREVFKEAIKKNMRLEVCISEDKESKLKEIINKLRLNETADIEFTGMTMFGPANLPDPVRRYEASSEDSYVMILDKKGGVFRKCIIREIQKFLNITTNL